MYIIIVINKYDNGNHSNSNNNHDTSNNKNDSRKKY